MVEQLLSQDSNTSEDTKTKPCRRCMKIQPFENFHNSKSASDGKVGHCKTCRRVDMQKYCDKHRERIRASQRDKYAENKEHYKKRNSVYYWTNKDSISSKRKAKRLEAQQAVEEKRERDAQKETT